MSVVSTQRTASAAVMRSAGGRRTLMCVMAFTIVSAALVLAAPRPAGRSDDRLAWDEEPVLEYRALRRMHAWNERFHQEAWMDAWTELHEGVFSYRIVSEHGSDKIRRKVLHAILDRERALVNDGHMDRGDLSTENYEFGEPRYGDGGSQYVPLKPRRRDVLLVDGRMVLSADGRELLRVEGKLAKNPSFWTTLVNVVRRYARLDGVRVPIATESTAKIRFAGMSRLEVDYQYESVNGRPLSVAARRVAAHASDR